MIRFAWKWIAAAALATLAASGARATACDGKSGASKPPPRLLVMEGDGARVAPDGPAGCCCHCCCCCFRSPSGSPGGRSPGRPENDDRVIRLFEGGGEVEWFSLDEDDAEEVFEDVDAPFLFHDGIGGGLLDELDGEELAIDFEEIESEIESLSDEIRALEEELHELRSALSVEEEEEEYRPSGGSDEDEDCDEGIEVETDEAPEVGAPDGNEGPTFVVGGGAPGGSVKRVPNAAGSTLKPGADSPRFGLALRGVTGGKGKPTGPNPFGRRVGPGGAVAGPRLGALTMTPPVEGGLFPAGPRRLRVVAPRLLSPRGGDASVVVRSHSGLAGGSSRSRSRSCCCSCCCCSCRSRGRSSDGVGHGSAGAAPEREIRIERRLAHPPAPRIERAPKAPPAPKPPRAPRPNRGPRSRSVTA